MGFSLSSSSSAHIAETTPLHGFLTTHALLSVSPYCLRRLTLSIALAPQRILSSHGTKVGRSESVGIANDTLSLFALCKPNSLG